MSQNSNVFPSSGIPPSFRPFLEERSTASIRYRNHRGEEAVRRVLPDRIWYGSSPYHPGDQWFLKAWDFDKQAERDFAMAGILSWELSKDET